jgi:hypothetical protein
MFRVLPRDHFNVLEMVLEGHLYYLFLDISPP